MACKCEGKSKICCGCNRQHPKCICDLIENTEEFLDDLDFENPIAVKVTRLLRRWLDAE